MPNIFAHIMLFGWPVVVLILFRLLPLAPALAWSIIGGYLLLPSRLYIDFPLLPPFDKALIPALAAGLCAVLTANAVSRPARRGAAAAGSVGTGTGIVLPGWLPRNRWGLGLVVALLAGTSMTVLTNGDFLVYGPTVLPGIRIYDAFSMSLELIVKILPFLLARKYLAHPESHKVLLGVLCLAMLLYSLPTLWEVRMSPQLNRQIYGFFPHSWLQHLRENGFRPVVFMVHGLQLGIILVVGLLATVGYMRLAEPRWKLPLALGALWIFATVFLAKTLGAFLIAVAILPVALLAGTRLQLLAAGIIAAIVLTYPVLRGNGLVPVTSLAQFAASIDADRAESLQYRFDNEDILLEKANERRLFGWGSWGRNRVYNDEGRDISTTDGAWIIAFSEGGWVRYLGQFGLLCGPIILLALRRKRSELTFATSALALALVANLLDLIPNAGMSPVTWLVAGALMGRLEVTASNPAAPETEAAAEPVRGLPYRRQFPASAATSSGPARTRPRPPVHPRRPEARFTRAPTHRSR